MIEYMKKKVILIGGAPTTGKSFLASKISEEMKIPWFSTDLTRRIMRKTVRKEDYPGLFKFVGLSAEDYLSSHTPSQVVDDQNKESYEVWKGVKALIEVDWMWDSFIIEGVGILPELIHRDFPNNKFIKPIFLLNKSKKRIREIVFERGLWADANKYPDKLKEKEVEWVVCFNEWLEKELKKYKYPIVEFEGNDIPMSRVKKFL